MFPTVAYSSGNGYSFKRRLSLFRFDQLIDNLKVDYMIFQGLINIVRYYCYQTVESAFRFILLVCRYKSP